MPEPFSFLGRLRRLIAGRDSGQDGAVVKLEKKYSQLDKRIDLLTRWHQDDRLVLRRIAHVLENGAAGRGRDRVRPPDDVSAGATHASPLQAPVAPSTPDQWNELRACPICGNTGATLVCEYNRFLVAERSPDETSKIYNYSLCHGCGVVYAARRPIGRRYRELLGGFHENLGRPGTPSAWLNPGALTDADREHLRARAARGAFVSEHAGIPAGEWLPGAFKDRLVVAQHVELLGSLLTLNKPRVLEIRSRTGAMLESLRRLYGASVYALPIFESQQETVRALYGIPADALIDFDRFDIPYDGAFDLVVSNHMLTHTLRPGEFLDRISAALAPDGHLYLYNEMDEVEYLSSTRSMFQILNPFHMQVLSPASLTRALASRGFTVKFLGHTDRIHLICLAQKTDPTPAVMPDSERKRRLRQYASARDVSILGLPERRREPFAGEWSQVVERAVLGGVVTLDERGRVQFVDRRKAQDEEAAEDADV